MDEEKNRRYTGIREWLSIQIAKNPARVILVTILVFNVLFFTVSAVVISWLAPESVQYRGFWDSIYYTISMILDAGCIEMVIDDVGTASVAVIVVCLVIVIVGSIMFTGAVIGYITNYISDFIETANAGGRQLHITGHMIILNWNSRAAEIISEFYRSEKPAKVVILVPSGKKEIERELEDRKQVVFAEEEKKGKKLKDRLTYIVWEGDTFSTKKLNDICIKQAKAVVILGKENYMSGGADADSSARDNGDTDLIKTLIQVAEMTKADDSANGQKIIVEVEDKWTGELVDKIVDYKDTKEMRIIAVKVNKILGEILAQFCVMPELNEVYSDLFSVDGASFYSKPYMPFLNARKVLEENILTHRRAIPLTCGGQGDNSVIYYVAEDAKDLEPDIKSGTNADPGAWDRGDTGEAPDTCKVEVNPEYWCKKRDVIILGHNSKCNDIMEGFRLFRNEWSFQKQTRTDAAGEEILNITVIDDGKNYQIGRNEASYIRCSEVSIFDKIKITKKLNKALDKCHGNVSILILSDDTVSRQDQDSNALTYLIYVQEVLRSRKDIVGPNGEKADVDVVVEIIDPKNYDIIKSYDIKNIVVSNRYISYMITQISSMKAMYDFYCDILTYDTDPDKASKELYVKQVKDFLLKYPAVCTARQLIRGVYENTKPVEDKIGDRIEGTDFGKNDNTAIVLGYKKKDGGITIFTGDNADRELHLEPDDKLIVFCNH